VAERRKRSPLGTTDIVARLLDVTEMSWDGDEVTDPICKEAANEIKRLRHRVDRLNAALDDVVAVTADKGILHRIKEARRG